MAIIKRQNMLSNLRTRSEGSKFPLVALLFPRIHNILMLVVGQRKGVTQARNRVAILEFVRDPSGRVVQIVATENEL